MKLEWTSILDKKSMILNLYTSKINMRFNTIGLLYRVCHGHCMFITAGSCCSSTLFSLLLVQIPLYLLLDSSLFYWELLKQAH